METNILKFELTATRHVDDNTPDTITASIGIPVEADDDAVNEAMNSDELIAYAVGVVRPCGLYAPTMAGWRGHRHDPRSLFR